MSQLYNFLSCLSLLPVLIGLINELHVVLKYRLGLLKKWLIFIRFKIHKEKTIKHHDVVKKKKINSTIKKNYLCCSIRSK